MTLIPGTFPQDEPLEIPGYVTESASKIVEQEELHSFSIRQDGHNKTRHQIHVIKQLEALVYILMAFQFVKYCHSACIVPILLHGTAQLILSCGSVTLARSRAEQTWLPTMIRTINQAEGLQAWEKEKRQDIIFRRVCWFMYAKTFFVCIYHGLVVAWLILIADEDKLSVIEHGTWWFVSFIGESTPNIHSKTVWFKKIIPLGLPQLILSDLAIMVLQLTLFQCIFRQSTLTYLGHRLNTDELTLIRTSTTDPTGAIRTIKDAPLVLKVKLYESLTKDAILSDQNYESSLDG